MYTTNPDVTPLESEIRALIDECQAMTNALADMEDWPDCQIRNFVSALDRKVEEISQAFSHLEDGEYELKNGETPDQSKSIEYQPPHPSALLTTKQAAKYLNLSSAFLERDRWAGAKVPFVRVGTRSIRYRVEDLDKFIESRKMHSTSEY